MAIYEEVSIPYELKTPEEKAAYAEKYGLEKGPGGQYFHHIYEGCVVSDWEHNMPDDSEFYALVWDEQDQCLKTYLWKYTGLGGSDYNGCSRDITPENLEKATRWFEPWLRNFIGDYKPAVHAWTPGRKVRVVKGRKLPLGTEGVVLYEGPSKFDRYGRVAKISLAGEIECWVDTSNLEFTDEDEFLYTSEEKEALYQANKSNFYLMFRSSPGTVDLRTRRW